MKCRRVSYDIKQFSALFFHFGADMRAVISTDGSLPMRGTDPWAEWKRLAERIPGGWERSADTGSLAVDSNSPHVSGVSLIDGGSVRLL
jgi:hypothetical protein